ncbi:hypothetical protein [Flavobacterium facile]|uniref:hypothetical protein n=1 Tax=Flavobacterium facile TaxID=2893174 RepID=UPI002E7709E5|nr:hypothetical protein [Flavobacterium sp. T-12]
MLISVVLTNSYAQTEKQLQEIVKEYDMVKANQLLQNVKQREALDKKLVEEFAKKNNLPIFSKKPNGGLDQITRISSIHNELMHQ